MNERDESNGQSLDVSEYWSSIDVPEFHLKERSVKHLEGAIQWEVSVRPRRIAVCVGGFSEDGVLKESQAVHLTLGEDLTMEKRPLGAPGYQMTSECLRLRASKPELADLLYERFARTMVEEISNEHPEIQDHILETQVDKLKTRLLVKFCVSFSQALRAATSIGLRCDLAGFGGHWDIGTDHVDIFIHDTIEGGTGISVQVFDLIDDVLRIMKQLTVPKSIEDDACCEKYCQKCLLIPHTPAMYLSKKLLDKRIVYPLV